MPARRSSTAVTARSVRADRALRRQGEETRSNLLAAAVPALAEKGYHASRVDDVVRVAGVSHGTFYLYFANMEDLFRSLAAQCADEAAELAASLGRVPDGPEGRMVLRTWLARFVQFYRRYGVVIRAWTENQVSDRTLARFGTKSFGRIAETLRARDDPGTRRIVSPARASGRGLAGTDRTLCVCDHLTRSRVG